MREKYPDKLSNPTTPAPEGKIKLELTKREAKQLFQYGFMIEDEKGKSKAFWERHEVIMEKLQGVIYDNQKVKK